MSDTERLLLDRQCPPWSPGWGLVLRVYLAGLDQFPARFTDRRPA